jgi:hypothetical protein
MILPMAVGSRSEWGLRMYIMFHPDQSFGDSLDFMLLNYYQPEAEGYRRGLLPDDTREQLAHSLDSIVDLLFGGATKLASADVALFGEAILSLSALGDFPEGVSTRLEYVLKGLDLRVASDVGDMARRAAERFSDLCLMARRTRLSKHTAHFLRRVSRCYLYGFDAECGIMCRSALDAEFQAEIPSDDCLRILGPRPIREGEPLLDLNDRIETARKTGRLTADAASVAHEIRRATNRLVHRNPKPPEDVVGLISGTISVITALGASKRRDRADGER